MQFWRMLMCFPVFFVPQQSGFANADLEEGLGRLAGAVAEFIKQEGGEKAVIVGDFIGSPRLKASGGPGLSLVIRASLTKAGISVKDKAPYQLMGRFTVRDEAAHDADAYESVALRISASILDKDDELLKRISISVFGPSALQIAGGTVDLPPKASEKERQEGARERFEKPKAAIVDAETRTVSESPFGVEVRVRRGRTDHTDPRAPKLVSGRSFVSLNKQEEYVVRIYNRAPFEAAVTLTIDGLSMFAFSTEGNFGSQILIPAGKYVEIPGWYVTKKQSDAFEITSYAKSAAASQGVISGVGTITATFHAAWGPADHPPNDELNPKGADAATGRGRQIEQRYEEVKRVVGRPRAVVSVRYNR